MRIRNTAHASKRTRHLYDEEVMGDEYDLPGITFSRENGVARVKQDVGKALVAKYPNLEVVESETDSDSDADAESDSESASTASDGEADESDTDSSE